MGQGMQWTHYLAMSVSHLCKISLAIRAICLPLFLGSLANNLVSIFEGGYPGGLDGKKKNLPAMQETQVSSLGQKDLLQKGMATHSSILA